MYYLFIPLPLKIISQGRRLYLFCSVLDGHFLEQCLQHRRCSLKNLLKIDKWVNSIPNHTVFISNIFSYICRFPNQNKTFPRTGVLFFGSKKIVILVMTSVMGINEVTQMRGKQEWRPHFKISNCLLICLLDFISPSPWGKHRLVHI